MEAVGLGRVMDKVGNNRMIGTISRVMVILIIQMGLGIIANHRVMAQFRIRIEAILGRMRMIADPTRIIMADNKTVMAYVRARINPNSRTGVIADGMRIIMADNLQMYQLLIGDTGATMKEFPL